MPITEPGIMMMANSLRRAPPDLAAATTIMINATNADNAIQAPLPSTDFTAGAISELGCSKYFLIPIIANTRTATSGIVTAMHQPSASRQGLPASWQDAFKLRVI